MEGYLSYCKTIFIIQIERKKHDFSSDPDPFFEMSDHDPYF